MPAGENKADPRIFRCQADIHRQRHGGADPDRRAIDGANDRLFRLIHAQRHLTAAVAVQAAHFLFALGDIVEGFGAAAEIGPGAEGPPRPGHDDGAHVIIRIRLVIRINKFLPHDACKGVEFVGPVQGDGQDLILNVILDMLIGHVLPLVIYMFIFPHHMR